MLVAHEQVYKIVHAPRTAARRVNMMATEEKPSTSAGAVAGQWRSTRWLRLVLQCR